MKKRGELQISFGMIFSIILIIIFLFFGFYAIRSFLRVQQTALVGLFLEDLQKDVNTLWQTSFEGSQEREYNLPNKIELVCFVDKNKGAKGQQFYNLFDDVGFSAIGDDNLVFYPIGSSEFSSSSINNINLEKIVNFENPYCIQNLGGKVKITLTKSIGEALVDIKRTT